MEKKHGIILAVVVAVVVAITVATLVFFRAYKFYESQTILTVINQHQQAVKDCTVHVRPGHPKPQRIFQTKTFVNELHNVDTSACPKRFQMAWLDYVQAWERKGEVTPDTALVDFLYGVGGVYAKSSKMADMAAEPHEAKNAVEQSWQRVERVAWEYDVQVLFQPLQHNSPQ